MKNLLWLLFFLLLVSPVEAVLGSSGGSSGGTTYTATLPLTVTGSVIAGGHYQNTDTGSNTTFSVADVIKADSGFYSLIQDKTITDTVNVDTINVVSGGYVTRTLDGVGGDTTFLEALESPSLSTYATRLMVEFTYADTGMAITWQTANMLFPGGVQPILTRTQNAKDLFSFIWNGTKWVLENFLPDIK